MVKRAFSAALILAGVFSLLGTAAAHPQSPVITPGDAPEVVKPRPGVSPTGDTPKIVAKGLTWDFGVAPQSIELTHDFIVTNEGTAPLNLTQVQTTCQCAASLPEKKVLAPGESSKITTTLKTLTFQGKITKAVNVISNDPVTPSLQLTITGTVLPPYTVAPAEVHLGKFSKTRPSDGQSFTVTISHGVSVHVTDTKSSNPLLVVERGEARDSEGFTIVPFTVHCKEGAPVGLLRESITISTDLATRPTAIVAVSADVEGEISLSPRSFNLGRVKEGENAHEDIVIKKAGDATLKLESVVVQPAAAFDAAITEIEKGRAYSVRVSLKPGAKRGYQRGSVTIQTNCPGENTLSSWFYAYVTP